jgi:hypothetical protein
MASDRIGVSDSVTVLLSAVKQTIYSGYEIPANTHQY